jgi:glutathione peroxidase-family protein
VVVVNTASFCGFTPQYQGLEALYAKYKDKGLVVLGFPSNDFSQETGSNKEIADFCENTFGVKFPMFTKTSVAGKDANPLFKQLAAKTGTTPRWNFYKYVIARDGVSVASFNSTADPASRAFVTGDRKAACSPITMRRGTAFSLTKIYLPLRELPGTACAHTYASAICCHKQRWRKTVSLLRSLLGRPGSAAIPGRSSSSLPPSFAPGRFAAFLYSSRQGPAPRRRVLRTVAFSSDIAGLAAEYISPGLQAQAVPTTAGSTDCAQADAVRHRVK